MPPRLRGPVNDDSSAGPRKPRVLTVPVPFLAETHDIMPNVERAETIQARRHRLSLIPKAVEIAYIPLFPVDCADRFCSVTRAGYGR